MADEFSRFTWAIYLHSKDETFKKFVALQTQLNHQLVVVKAYNNSEFDNSSFIDFCREHEVSHNFSAPRTPQENSVVERKNS